MNTLNKNELRQKYRALRDSFGEDFINEASLLACENLANCKEFINSDLVLLYYPTKNEISPLPIFELCLKMGKTVAFPVCQRETSNLVFKKINTLDSLSCGNFGIFEPNENCELVFPNQNTLCIVPAVAFSCDGHRIGYGRGFYDRFLANFKGVSAGFSYSLLVFDKLPHKKHDIPLDMIITESEVRYIVEKD